MEEASVKFRDHGVMDEPEDMNLGVWAGLIPLQIRALEPQPDESGKQGLAMPEYVEKYHR